MDGTNRSPPSAGLRRSELPWVYRPWCVALGSGFAVAFAVLVVLIEWHLKRVAVWPEVVVFAVGAGIGLTGVRAMVGLGQASWPLRKLRWDFTEGRFFTLKCPMFSPAYWRAVRQFRQAREAEGLPPGPTLGKRVLPCVLLAAACCVGVAAGMWSGVWTCPMLAFLGCILTLGPLPSCLWWRDLPE